MSERIDGDCNVCVCICCFFFSFSLFGVLSSYTCGKCLLDADMDESINIELVRVNERDVVVRGLYNCWQGIGKWYSSEEIEYFFVSSVCVC